MKKNKLLTLLMLSSISASSLTFSKGSSYDLCFTPGDNCDGMIAEKVLESKKNIYVQAYHLTNEKIIKSLIEAKAHGVDVFVILDKTAVHESKRLADREIPVMIDYKPRIAHNKVMIIDGETVITGSFNFTQSAQSKNAENVIIINDGDIAKAYKYNFDSRIRKSKKAIDKTR